MQFCFDATRFGTGLNGAVELAAARGFNSVEYSFAPFDTNAKSKVVLAAAEKTFLSKVRKLSEKLAISIACLNLDDCLIASNKQSYKNFQAMVMKLGHVANALGCPKVTIMVMPDEKNGALAEVQEKMAQLCDNLEQINVRLLLRLSTAPAFRGRSLKHWRAMEPQDWRDFIAACPGLGLSFSPADCVWLGIDYLAVLSGLASAIEHVEAHDIEINRDLLKDSGMYGPLWWRYRVPGKGQVDWTQLIECLKLYDFRGSFSIHLDDEFLADDQESLEAGLETSSKLLKPLVQS